MRTHARPPPRVAISHDAMHAKTMTAVLWYQSEGLSDVSMYVCEEGMHTTKELFVKLALEEILMI